MSRQAERVDGGDRAATGMIAAMTSWGRRRGGLLAIAALAAVVTATGDLSTRRRPHELSAFLVLPGWVAVAAVVTGVFAAAVALVATGRQALGRRTERFTPTRPPEPAPRHDTELPASPEPVSRRATPSDALGPFAEHLLVKTGRTTTLVRTAELLRVEADGRYVWLVVAERRHLAQYTLKELESRLDPTTFVRVHRSTIVNVRRIRQLRTRDYRDYDLVLDDGSCVRMSRSYRARLQAALSANADARLPLADGGS